MSPPIAPVSAAESAQTRANRGKAAGAWLGLLCEALDGATRGLVLFSAETDAVNAERWRPAAHWPEPEGDFTRLTTVAEAAGAKERTVVRPHPKPAESDAADVHDVGIPIEVAGETVALVALEVAQCPEPRLPRVIRQLQQASSSLSMMLRTGSPRPGATTTRGLESALWLIATVLEHDKVRGAATAVATELAARMDCERVAIGFLDGLKMKVQALSHSADFGERMNLIRRIEATMDEAFDQRSSIAVPAPEGAPVRATRAHAELMDAEDSGAVCTVLLGWNDAIVGAICLERPPGNPFLAEEIETLEDMSALLGPILELKRRDDRWLVLKAWDAIRAEGQKLFGPRHFAMKAVGVAVLAVLLFLSFWTGTFRVTAPAALEGEVVRAAVAPLNGFIVEAPVRAGEVVTAGQLLAVLDDRSLRLEQRNWQSQRGQIESEYLEAMAERNRVQMSVLRSRMDQADAQLGLIEEQLGRMRVEAPIDGLVVSGDLTQSIGAPVEQGEVLFEVAPLDSYRLMLRVDERDIAYVRPEQTGSLLLSAMPGERQRFTVERVTPVSTAEEGTNYFLVQADLEDAPELLRPGMEGVAKVEIGEARLIWISTRRITDWLRLWIWSWWGSG